MIHECAALGKRLLGEASQKHCDSLGNANGLSTYIRLLRLWSFGLSPVVRDRAHARFMQSI